MFISYSPSYWLGQDADLDWLTEVDNVGEVVSPVTSQVKHQGHLKCRLF